VRSRRTKKRHHRVADELLDRAAEPLELGSQALVVRAKDRLDVFWIELLCARCEADQSANRTVTTLRSRRPSMIS
jgi:hypothetical protein